MSAPDCFPTCDEESLLVAALGEPETARAAWERLRGNAILREGAARRLLPLLHDNLRRAGVPAGELAAARQARLHTLASCELLFRSIAPVVAALERAGIETVLLKGASYALVAYGNADLRPMSDIDLLVRGGDVDRAALVLEEHGFRSRQVPDARRRELVHAEDFADAPGRHIDLHWRLFPHQVEVDDGLWARLEAVEMAGVPVRVLGGADELLHTIVHGLHWSPTPTVRWVADAAAVLRRRSVDWTVFAQGAARAGRVTAARDGLACLHRILGTPNPDAALQALDRVAGDPWRDRLDYRIGTRRRTYTVLGGIPVFALRYIDDARRRGLTPNPVGFFDFLRELWGYSSGSDVFGRMLRRALARTRSRIEGTPLPPLE